MTNGRHKLLEKKAIVAIRNVHGDTDVSLETTLDTLVGLREEVNMLIEAVESDLRMQSDQ